MLDSNIHSLNVNCSKVPLGLEANMEELEGCQGLRGTGTADDFSEMARLLC
jgi:hypothetical protein